MIKKFALVALSLFALFVMLATGNAHAVMPASAKVAAIPGEVSGVVSVPTPLQKKISTDAALYIFARPAGVDFGPPLVVKRVEQPFHFPYHFTLSQADAMMPNLSFKGPVTVTARISQSGSATPVSQGDLEPRSKPKSVTVGSARSVTIVLDHER